MKTTLQLCSILIFLLSLNFNINAQAHTDDTWLILLDENMTQAEIDEYRNDFNSTEVWQAPLSGIRLWKVDSFPYIHPPSGDWIIDINETKEKSETEGNNNNNTSQMEGLDIIGDLNGVIAGSSMLPPQSLDESMDCDGNLSTFIEADTKGFPVNVGVFDSGYTSSVGNIPGYFYGDIGSYTQYDHMHNDPLAEDNNGHGTHITSIISHVSKKYNAENNLPLPNVVMDIHKIFDGDGTASTLSTVILAFENAVKNGMKIANFSWSARMTEADAANNPFQISMVKAQEHGVLIVAAAGNDYDCNNYPIAYLNYPAAYDYDNILSVASYDCDTDDLADFSNCGTPYYDIAASGYDIFGETNTGFASKSGTSQSTAIVTGVAAALASYGPGIDYSDIICAIMEGAEFNTNLDGDLVSNGVLHADDALTALFGHCDAPIFSISNTSTTPVQLDEVYPNPNSGTVNINVDATKDAFVNIKIYNLLGKVVLEEERFMHPGQNHISIDQTNSKPGSYLLVLEYNDQIEMHKYALVR